jgi:hypothetical protein
MSISVQYPRHPPYDESTDRSAKGCAVSAKIHRAPRALEGDSAASERGEVMRKIANSQLWFLALVLAGVIGCGAESAGTGSQEEGDLAKADQALWKGYRGGWGGTAFDTLSCNYLGYDMHCGSYVDQLTLRCYTPFQYYNQGPYGGSGGSDYGWVVCPSGQYLLGIFGSAGNYINKLGFICGTPDHSVMQDGYTCGNTAGGAAFRDVCPWGEIVKEIYGRSGSWLDGIQIRCDIADGVIY